MTGTIEDFPFLPEARAVVAALVNRLRLADATSGAAHLVALLDGIGLSTATGLVPDSLSHLLHDPVAFIAPQLTAVPGRSAILDAIAALVPDATRAGDVVTITSGPATLTIDLALPSSSRVGDRQRGCARMATGTARSRWISADWQRADRRCELQRRRHPVRVRTVHRVARAGVGHRPGGGGSAVAEPRHRRRGELRRGGGAGRSDPAHLDRDPWPRRDRPHHRRRPCRRARPAHRA